MPFEKGRSGNPNGRPPVVLPEVQRAIDANRNAIKVLILQKLDPKVEAWIENIIDEGTEQGDAIRLKTLLELVFGRIPVAEPEFQLSDEEKLLVLAFRERKRALPSSEPTSG